MDDVRKWEDLPVDCLVDIFARVSVWSLMGVVPYVCKSWFKATLCPLCWQSLNLRDLPLHRFARRRHGTNNRKYYQTSHRDKLISFVKFLIRRSHGLVTEFALRNRYFKAQEVLNLVAEGCPKLRKLGLLSPKGSYNYDYNIPMLSNLICKWKDLEALEIDRECLLEEDILSQISLRCKKFRSLSFTGFYIGESKASAIASLLPNLEFLSLNGSLHERSNLMIILKGCKKLVHLDVGNCISYEVDDEILNLAAHIPIFNFLNVFFVEEIIDEWPEY